MLRGSGTSFNPSKRMMKLENGTSASAKDIEAIEYLRVEVNHCSKIFLKGLKDLEMKLKNPDHQLSNKGLYNLRSKELIDENKNLTDSVKNIVLCSFDKESRQLRSPTI